MNKKLLFLILLAVVLVPTFAYAQNTINDIVKSASHELSLLGGGLATIAFIVAGIMFLTATGNPSRMTIAKGALVAGVIGIIIIVLADNAEEFIKNIFFNAG